MQFEYTAPQTPVEEFFGGFYCVNAFGPIEIGDDEKFVEFLQNAEVPPRTSLYIDSTGGDVDAALSIGRIVRDRWFSTHIGQYVLDHDQESELLKKRKRTDGSCMSAATLVFLGGRLRYHEGGSRFGVRQFSFRNPSPEHIARSQILSAKIARFVTDMGVPASFLELASATPSNNIKVLSIDELTQHGVITGGETPVTWTIQAVPGGIYVRGERDNLFGHHKMLLCFNKEEGFIAYAVIESLGREQELTTFPLVELVLETDNSDESVVDISDRCVRTIRGIYTNISASITHVEASAIAKSEGFGIRVRAGDDAPLFLGIGPMKVGDGRNLIETFVSCLTR